MEKNINNNKKIFIIPPVKGYLSRNEWETACWQKVSASKKLIKLLCTAHERHQFILRVAILERLQVGKSYKEIGEELFVSPQTISTIKKVLDGKLYESYSERSKKERKTKEYSSYNSSKKKKTGKLIRTKYGTKRITHPLY